MMRTPLFLAAVLAAAGPIQEPSKDQLRQALGDSDLVGTWIYDDFPAACAEATQSGKPLMVVIRCVP